MNNKFQLEMLSGPTPAKIYPIEKDEIIGGREPSCDIIISDAEVSRKHFRLYWSEPGYIIEDLGSTNGIFINDVKMNTPQGLHGGEKLFLGGNVVLEYQVIPAAFQETIISDKFIPAEETSEKQADATYEDMVDDSSKLLNPELDLMNKEISPIDESSAGSESNPPEKSPKKRNRSLIALIIILLLIIGSIMIFLYFAPTSFWCKFLPFIFKPEIYPACMP